MSVSIKKVRLMAARLMVPLVLVLAEPTGRLMLAGAVLAVLGGLLRAWAAGTIRKNAVLTTGGPYAHTRNPLYLGSFLVGLGLMVSAGSLPLVALYLVLFTAVYGKTMRVEERQLEKLFGEQFHAYAAAVPLFLPRLRPYRPVEPQTTQFLLRRYFVHREWEFALGVAAGFVALALKAIWF